MVNNALGAIINNALGAMVEKALGATGYVALQASLTITHTAHNPPKPGRYVSSSQVCVIGRGGVAQLRTIP